LAAEQWQSQVSQVRYCSKHHGCSPEVDVWISGDVDIQKYKGDRTVYLGSSF
jgi:hypothetical protein